MKKILEGSQAVAETVNGCRPGVVCAYPITPQTHIVEKLAELKAAGRANFEYILAESEFAAASIVEGASAAGSRSYTASSSQGLLLMIEVLFNIAGMRFPVVLTCANRALSAPISIWNDQQDVMTVRDSGWLIWFGETVQEVSDLHILAYRVAEKAKLPVMVNLDGYVLTHVIEPVEIEPAEKIRKFLPPYRPEEYLNVKRPLTFGAFATPEHYFEIRQDLHSQVVASKEIIVRQAEKFKKVFDRPVKLVEYYGDPKAKVVLAALGSVVGTAKEAVDRLRSRGKRAAVLKIVSLRPFPEFEIAEALAKAGRLAVIDKSVSLGAEGILAGEFRRAVPDKKIISFVAGLGGRDITLETIENIFLTAEKTKEKLIFVPK